MKKKRLFLIDGNAFCYRAYYAIKELKNSKGHPTNAVYGFVRILKKLVDNEKPDYIAVAFDLKGPTFRHEKFKEYKIQRKPMPSDLVIQMPIIKEIISGYNMAIFEKEGFEADDVIATLAKKAAKEGIEVFIVTGDKDVLQLVDDNIKAYNIHKEGLIIYDKETVKNRFSGLGPENITDIMALSGDTIDNIPGVHGIGEKTAIELIKEFNNIENLYDNLNMVRSKAKKDLLLKGRDNAFLSKELATMDAAVPIDIEISALKLQQPDSEKLLRIFKELEFQSLAKELVSQDSEVKKSAVYKTIASQKDFDFFMAELKKQREFALDFETTNANPLVAVPVGVSFSWAVSEAYYIVFLDKGKGEGLYMDYVFESLKSLLENPEIKKIGHNIKYEKLILSKYGIELKGISFDTMVASYILNPSKLNHNMDDLAFEYLDHKTISLKDILGLGKNKIGIKDVPIERLSEYGCEDSDVTLRLKKVFEQKLFEKEQDKLFMEIELPLIDVLADIEKTGVKIDTKLLKQTSECMDKELSEIVANIYKMAGTEFNINSHRQLSEILFERIGLPVIKKTKTGVSTDVSVLERLAAVHALPKELLRYRELTKLKSTYIDALPELINPNTKRLHTSFNQTVTATGRLSSSRPNLQNIPIKTEQGRLIRKAFVGEKGRLLLSGDYSQIELRIMAHLSKDEELISAFENNRDVHTHTASLIFNIEEKDVTPEMRANAKTVNFGIIYGMSAYGLSQSLSIAPESAQQFIDAYFERYPRVKLYMEEKIEEARETGYVTTIFNRRRYISEINSPNMRERQQAERIAINTPIQGSSADLIKIAMINIHRAMKEKNVSSVMILQVHDELLFEVQEEEIDIMKKLVKWHMENAVKLNIPMEVGIKYGPNWLEMDKA